MSEFDDVERAAELDAQERRVRDLLRGAADVGPMPADVVARLDAALAAAQPATPVASLTGRRRSRLPRLLAAAAAVVVLGGGAAAAVHGLQGSAPSASSAGSAAGSSADQAQIPADAKILLSGTDYTDVAAVQDLGEESLDAPAAQDAQTAPKPNLLSKQESSDESASSDPSQRPQAEHALTCATALGVDPSTVRVVEIANWKSEPAAFVVHTTSDAAEVVVVSLDCTPGDEALSTVPVPS